MDATESAALQQLGERAEWPVDELPDEIDADVLRCLDQMQLVEVCSVVLVNQQKQPGETSPPAQSHEPWFSPIEQPVIGEGWKGIRSTPALGTDPPEPSRVDISEATRDDFGGFFPRRTHRIASLWVPKAPVAFIVRLNERGRAELAHQRRAGPPSAWDSDSMRQYDEGLDRLIQSTKVVAQGAAQSPMALAAPSAGPRVGDDLLRYLANQPNEMAAVVELPEGFLDPDMLTICDADGLVEFGTRNHCWAGAELRVERGWDFGSIIGPHYKPMKQFIAEALSHTGDERIQPHVRITAQGRVRAARLKVDQLAGQSEAKSNETAWRDVQKRLCVMYERCDPWLGYDHLELRLHCSRSTIQKAIKPPPSALRALPEPDRTAAAAAGRKLAGWRERFTGAKGSPRAGRLTEVHLDSIAQTRERDPAEDTDADELDVVLARLLQQAQPEDRARLNNMTTEQHREFVSQLRNDPDKYNRMLGCES